MRKTSMGVFILTAVFLIGLIGAASAEDVKIKDIRAHISKFRNEMVSVTGFIYKFVEDDARSTDYYKIRDDWGGIIYVRTASGLPVVGKRYTVTGIVDVNEAGTIFISETSRVEVVAPDVEKKETPPVGTVIEEKKPEEKGITPVVQAAIVVAAVIFLALVVVLIIMLTRKSKAEEIPTEAIAPDPAVDEGKTVVMKKAPPGTMKLIPGKLVVLKGEDHQKEIRFRLPKDQTSMEFTFGRQAIPDQNPYGHIQLKADTASRLQAKLSYADDGFTLVNHSTVNPTTVNGKALGENESVKLNDGDIITMGEVEFKYEAK